MGYWRLETPGGVRFGHRLWVDIVVTELLYSALMGEGAAEDAEGGGVPRQAEPCEQQPCKQPCL